jgi:hypothetical protein
MTDDEHLAVAYRLGHDLARRLLRAGKPIDRRYRMPGARP